MPIRVFKNARGEEWRVWDVMPHLRSGSERRSADRRRPRAEPWTGPERRTGHDRRLRTPRLLTPGLETGWLCFECEGAKRRLSPIPEGWDDVPEEQLEALIVRAMPVARRLNE